MPHRDTSVAIKQAITSALNATQAYAIKQTIPSALNATQGHKRNYQTSYYFGSKCHTGTQAQLLSKLLLRL